MGVNLLSLTVHVWSQEWRCTLEQQLEWTFFSTRSLSARRLFKLLLFSGVYGSSLLSHPPSILNASLTFLLLRSLSLSYLSPPPCHSTYHSPSMIPLHALFNLIFTRISLYTGRPTHSLTSQLNLSFTDSFSLTTHSLPHLPWSSSPKNLFFLLPSPSSNLQSPAKYVPFIFVGVL